MDTLEQLLEEAKVCLDETDLIREKFHQDIDEYTNRLDQCKDKLYALIIAEPNIELAQNIANSLYWNRRMPMAGKIKAIWKYKTGHIFIPTPIETTLTCYICQKSFSYFGTSVADVNNQYARLCPNCQSRRDEQNRLDHETYTHQAERYARRLAELKTMPYQEYLQTPEWKETRQKAYKRAHFKCQLCSSSGQLNVHHRDYSRRGEEENSDLIVLCQSCHAKFHGKA